MHIAKSFRYKIEKRRSNACNFTGTTLLHHNSSSFICLVTINSWILKHVFFLYSSLIRGAMIKNMQNLVLTWKSFQFDVVYYIYENIKTNLENVTYFVFFSYLRSRYLYFKISTHYIMSNNSSLQVDGSHCLYIYLLHWIYKNYALLAVETLFECFLIFDYLEFIRL